MAGFEIVGRRLWLVVLPILLDVFLWLGPRLSVVQMFEPLVSQVRIQIQALPSMTHSQAFEMAEALKLLDLLGERLNLFSLLGLLPVLNVPSLLAGHPVEVLSPLGRPWQHPVSGVDGLLGWGIVLIPLGLLLGFVYLNALARWVRERRLADAQAAGDVEVEVTGSDEAKEVVAPFQPRNWAWKLFRVVLFEIGIFILAMFLLLFVAVVGTAVHLRFGIIGAGVFVYFSIGLALYVGMHLLFVIPGVLVGGRGLWRATWESIALLHTQSFSVLGLVLLVILAQGLLSRVWLIPTPDSWVFLVGILGNGCIVTGLMAGVFVFYRERIGELKKLFQVRAN